MGQGLEQIVKTALETVMEEGFQVASVGFASAQYDGRNDVVVDAPYWDGNTLYLTARGEAVAFIEFGTGTVKYSEPYPDASVYERLHLSQRGEFGFGRGKGRKWVYYGEAGSQGLVIGDAPSGEGEKVLTEGNPPANAMYAASLLLEDKQKIVDAVRRAIS